MKVSINSIRKVNQIYGSAGDPAPQGVDDLLKKIGSQLAGIDECIEYGKRFEGVLVVKIAACEPHPQADRLTICMIDDGGKSEDVERDERGLVQVVCGAANVREGLVVAWLPPGATVPSTYGKEPFVLEARPLRGVVSNGMLASPKELTIGDNHEGILELDTDAAPGTPFAVAYDLEGDVVIDMENKMFTHRPDCFGQLGVAREIEGIQQRPYKSPDWYSPNPPIPAVESGALPLEVINELPDVVPRFMAIAMRDITIKPSPIWLQIYLSKLGIRPLNNIVDYTNFFMLETGQPIHAYDYDKVKVLSAGDGARLIVRHPHSGEKITLLNGKTIEPGAEAMMVATDKQLICVGGAMGGATTEVDEQTKNIIIEAANWDMYETRRTAMAQGIFTDAVTRFTKGQSPLQNRAVVAKIVDEIRHVADGKVASELIDDNHVSPEVLERGSLHEPVTVSRQFINERLGLELSSAQMATLLHNVEFGVAVDADQLTVKAPFWRTDIEIREDVVEEIGRLYGYDHLPLELPRRDLTPASKNPRLLLKATIRELLSQAGANEVLAYSFVHGNLLRKAGQDPSRAFQLSNALSPDLQYYRLNLIPSLLDKVHPNIKAGHSEFALFELGKGHSLAHKENGEDALPREAQNLALVYAADDKLDRSGAAYYQARAFLMHVATSLGLRLGFKRLSEASSDKIDHNLIQSYAPSRSALVFVKNSGAEEVLLGIVGEFTPAVRQNFKLPRRVAGFEIDVDALLQNSKSTSRYVALPRFPKVEQDICLKVPAALTYQEVFDVAWKSLAEVQPERTLPTLSPIDIYQREDDPAHKQITLRLSLASFDRTLTDEEAGRLLNHVAAAAQEKLSAQRL